MSQATVKGGETALTHNGVWRGTILKVFGAELTAGQRRVVETTHDCYAISVVQAWLRRKGILGPDELLLSFLNGTKP